MDRRGRALAHVVLETPELDTLVRTLTDLRAALADSVPAALDPGARLAVLIDPAWQVKPQAPGAGRDGAVLVLRHPGFGWQGYELSRPQAAALGYSLRGREGVARRDERADAGRRCLAAPPRSIKR